MPSDRKQAVATATVGTSGVLGGALLRGTGVERARRLTGTHHHLAVNDIRRALRVTHGRKAGLMYAGGIGLGALSAPAAVIGSSQAVKKDFVTDGFNGAAQALHLKAKNAVQPKPTKARFAGLAVGAASGGAGTLAAHKVLDAADKRRVARGVTRIGFKGRTTIAAAGGLAGTLAGIAPGGALTRHVAPGYTLTAAGVKRDTKVRKDWVSPDLDPRCPICGTRTAGACPVCHDLPVAITKAATVHLAVGRGRAAACNVAGEPRTSRSTNSVTCAACKRTHGFRSRTSVSKRTVAQNALRWGAGIGTVGVAGGATEAARGKKRHTITDEAVGAAAGQGAYQAAGYGAKHYGLRRLEPQTTRSQRDKQLKPVKREHGAYTAAMERHYPKGLPEAPVHRVLGYTHRGTTGNVLGGAATVLGATVAGNAASRHNARVSKLSETPGAKRARIYAAGSTPGIGMVTAARQAGREAPHSQRHQASAIQFGGTLGTGVAGAYGLSAAANKVPAVGRGVARAGAARDRAVRGAVKRVTGHELPTGPGRIARAKAVARSGIERQGLSHPQAAERVARAARPLTRAGAPVALAGYTAGKFLGGQGAISLNQHRAGHVRKADSLLSRGEEQRSIRRQRHNAAIGTLNAGIGATGVGLYAGSLHPKVPVHVRAKLSRAAISTTIAAGGVGALGAARGAQAQRHDAKVRQARLNHRGPLPSFAKALTPLAVPRAGYVATRQTRKGLRSYSVRGTV